MRFKILQHTLRIKTRVLIVKTGDVAERNKIVFGSVNPAATVFFCGERPAHGVNDLALFDRAGWHFPQLFYANAVNLRVESFLQIVAADKLLGQRATRSFRQDGDFRLHVIAGLEVWFLLAMLVHALIVGTNPNYMIAFHKEL